VEQRRALAVRDVLASASIFSSAVNDVMEARLRDVSGDRVTFPQLKVLTLVAHTEGIGVSDVATFLGVSAAAASKAVRRLVEKGLLERHFVPSDRRVQHLALTSEAERLLRDYDSAAEESLDELFGDLDPAELRRLAVSLDRLSLPVAEAAANGGPEACFRCGIYFRDRCLLRGSRTSRVCYQHLGDRGIARDEADIYVKRGEIG